MKAVGSTTSHMLPSLGTPRLRMKLMYLRLIESLTKQLRRALESKQLEERLALFSLRVR